MKHVCLHIELYVGLNQVMKWCRENGFPAVVVCDEHPRIPNRRVLSSKHAIEDRTWDKPLLFNRRVCIREDDYPMVVLRFPWVKEYEARRLGYG